MVKIFEVPDLANRPGDGTFDMEAYESSIQSKLKPNHGKNPFTKDAPAEGDEGMDAEEESKEPKTGGGNENDWSDDDSDDDSDSDDDDDDSDMSDGNRHKKKNKKLNPKSNTAGKS